MRRDHFDELAPVCPVCRRDDRGLQRLTLDRVDRRDGDIIVEGVLHCPETTCRREYPILDGIPVLIPDIRAYVSDNLYHLTVRDDLTPHSEGILGDCAGPGTLHDAVRQHLSTYAWDHYADLDPEEPRGDVQPGASVRCLDSGLQLTGCGPDGPAVDLGCATGRTAFALAGGRKGLVLGIDVNFSMLRTAYRVLRSGTVRYPRRRVGVVYDVREFEVRLEDGDRVDFWACDAQALPFADGTFAMATAINLLDCVASPAELLRTLSRVLGDRGVGLLTTPYDWSVGTTPVEAWIGGHSQRGETRGAAEPLLRSLLTPGAHPLSPPGLKITGEVEKLEWHTRLHDRSRVSYDVHVVGVAKSGGATTR